MFIPHRSGVLVCAALALTLAATCQVTAAESAASPQTLAAQVKELFRVRCLECHGSKSPKGGVRILEYEQLVRKKKIIPGKPDESRLYQFLTATDETVMPPAEKPRLRPEDVDLVRRWLTAQAPPFPEDVAVPAETNKDATLKDVVGVDYVLKKILEHVRALPIGERRFVRYFSINHLLAAGSTREFLDLQADALAKAINHLSREPEIVRPQPLDAPVNSIFSVDIRKLGWHAQPFTRLENGKAQGPSSITLFDLALLEYPYGVRYEDSETYDHLVEEFLKPSGAVRPIPYLRADWFISVATQPPLYEDLLRLPFTVKELEDELGVDAEGNLKNGIARRAGMAISGVSHNNRAVERHPARHGAYWKSFDFKSSRGQDNIFQDPLDLHPTGGEMIFNLPNGLQGYVLATAKGDRLEAAPTEIVTDKFAADQTVRNGLACMRCHDQGMKDFIDNVRPAVERLPGGAGLDKRYLLQLYPEQAELTKLLQQDTQRFLGAMQQALGRPQGDEPLRAASRRFLDEALDLTLARGELGLADPAGLEHVFRTPQFTGLGLLPLAAGGLVRRDMWEDYYDQVIRQLGLGTPIVPLDGLGRRDFRTPQSPDVELATNRRGNVFEPGDRLVIFVTNRSSRDVFIELIGTSARGEKVILVPATTVVRAGAKYRFPPQDGIKIQPSVGREQITLFASETAFPAGELLRGKGVVDRVIHAFYAPGERRGQRDEPARVLKRTLEIETR